MRPEGEQRLKPPTPPLSRPAGEGGRASGRVREGKPGNSGRQSWPLWQAYFTRVKCYEIPKSLNPQIPITNQITNHQHPRQTDAAFVGNAGGRPRVCFLPARIQKTRGQPDAAQNLRTFSHRIRRKLLQRICSQRGKNPARKKMPLAGGAGTYQGQ